MSFQKKAKTEVKDTRHTKYGALVHREAKVASLRSQNTTESRKVLKQMGDVVYRGTRSNLQDWYAPKGVKVNAKYKPHKAG